MTSAPIENYDELMRALVARRHELGLSQHDVDDIAGIASGYCGKLECGMKGFGRMSFDAMLGALGVKIMLVPAEKLHPAVKRRQHELIARQAA